MVKEKIFRGNKMTFKKTISLLGLFLVISFIYTLPMLRLTSPHFQLLQGDDLAFHFMRTFSMTDQLKEMGYPTGVGNFSPFQYAYGVNLFYPYETTVLPLALLTMAVGNIFKGYYLYVLLLTFLTLLSAYYGMRYFLKLQLLPLSDKGMKIAPFIFAVVYSFSQYRLVNIFMRTALGEGAAFVFLPLIMAGFFSLFFDQGKKKSWLIFGMAGLIYTHFVSSLLVVLFLVICLLLLIPKWSVTVWKQLIFSGAMAALLSAFCLVPMLEQMQHLDITGAYQASLVEGAQMTGSLAYLFSFVSPEKYSYYTVGIFILIPYLGSLLLFFLPGKKNLFRNKFGFLLLIMTGLLIFMTTNVFPWDYLEDSFIQIIQFPFRLNLLATLLGAVCGSLFFAEVLTAFSKHSGLLITVSLLLYLATPLVVSQYLTIQKIMEKYTTATDLQKDGYYNEVSLSMFDYLPKIADPYEYLNKQGKINQEKTTIDYTMTGNRAKVNTEKIVANSTVELPLAGYKGVTVKDSDGKDLSFKVAKNGKIRLTKFPKDKFVTVIYQATLLYKVSFFVSAATLIFLPIILKFRNTRGSK